MQQLDPIEISRSVQFVQELATTAARVNTFIEMTRIHQPGQDYAPIALQFPALDDTVTEIPFNLRH